MRHKCKVTGRCKNIMIRGQIYQIALQKNDVVAINAFVGTALKCCFEAANAEGS